MAKYTLLLCILLNAWQCFAQTAYVAAPKGLKLRKTADANGVVVKTIPYGTTVRYLKDAKAKVPHKIKEADNFFLNGYWQKVILGADSGYVFDAFLLNVKPHSMQELMDTTDDVACKPFELTFLEKRFPKTGELYKVKSWVPADSNWVEDEKSPYCVHEFSQKLAGGNIVYECTQSRAETHDGGTSITFYNMNFNQVYSLILSFTAIENSDSPLTVAMVDGAIEISPDGAGCYSTIHVKGNTIVWELWCGC